MTYYVPPLSPLVSAKVFVADVYVRQSLRAQQRWLYPEISNLNPVFVWHSCSPRQVVSL